MLVLAIWSPACPGASLAAFAPQPNLVQYDGLFGPQTVTLERMRPTNDCYCQTNARTIDKVRALRSR
jgi:hypothetical protein